MAIVELPQLAEGESAPLLPSGGLPTADAGAGSAPDGVPGDKHPNGQVGRHPAALTARSAEREAGQDATDYGSRVASFGGVPLPIVFSLLRQRDGAALTRLLLEAAAEITGAAHTAVVVHTSDGQVARVVQHRAGEGPEAEAANGCDDSSLPAQPRRFLKAHYAGPGGLASVLYAGDKHSGSFSAADQRRLTTLAALAEVAADWQGQLEKARELATATAAPGASNAAEQGRQPILRQVIDAQEAERARVARDLHDEVGQALTSVLLGLHLVDTALTSDPVDAARAATRAAEVRALVAEALREVRRMAFDLRPTVLDDLGLLAAVERLGDNLHERHGLRVEIQVRGITVEDRLPEPVETVVYRVVQESLTNVVRHAHASAVRVILHRDAQRLRALVRDDGVGFDASATTSTLGLRGMAERAEMAGGAVRLHSAPGGGCTVELEVPVG